MKVLARDVAAKLPSGDREAGGNSFKVTRQSRRKEDVYKEKRRLESEVFKLPLSLDERQPLPSIATPRLDGRWHFVLVLDRGKGRENRIAKEKDRERESNILRGRRLRSPVISIMAFAPDARVTLDRLFAPECRKRMYHFSTCTCATTR